jgi:hypothetical protein
VLPPKLLAVIVWLVVVCVIVGVPLMAQVVELMPKPVGREGLTVQLDIVPVTLGVWVDIATFLVNTKGEPL